MKWVEIAIDDSEAHITSDMCARALFIDSGVPVSEPQTVWNATVYRWELPDFLSHKLYEKHIIPLLEQRIREMTDGRDNRWGRIFESDPPSKEDIQNES